jgi:hypothetical protein
MLNKKQKIDLEELESMFEDSDDLEEEEIFIAS